MIKIVIDRLTHMLSWSDRIGSDEIVEIRELINQLKQSKLLYTKKDMEKSFIAGGKLNKNINIDEFNEFIEKL